ncbi:hypothetical protein [Phenylobacterium montanum]|uniref:Uncharacterized protein n=1 Tax=Phenylobacterium montanum TaxID=2823693 RepID=A0A975IT16_9CAUL|nr:hypothetical protein [Caulobacter sp. S6]QUD86313.1 hypothetical protein KCG34_14525 [Caulobacter sp. S6]
MKSNLSKIGMGFLIGFAVLCVALIAFQAYYIWPMQRCEEAGNWWDPQDRVCAVPLPISQFTGRKVGGKEVITRLGPGGKPGEGR